MDPITATQSWIQNLVIDLGLCPFAAKVFNGDNILYEGFTFTNVEKLKDKTIQMCEILFDDASDMETGILIASKGLESFEDYLSTFYTLEDMLTQCDYHSEIQLASFHPSYQFEGTQRNDVENFTNRSPYPMIHILRLADVTKAIDSHPDINSVPPRNIEMMKTLGIDKLNEILKTT